MVEPEPEPELEPEEMRTSRAVRDGRGMVRAPVASKARAGPSGASAVDLTQTLRRQQDERIRAAIEYLSSPGVWSRPGEENMAHVQNAFRITDTEGKCGCSTWPPLSCDATHSAYSRADHLSRFHATQQSLSSSNKRR